MVQWLKRCIPNAMVVLDSISGQETRSHMPQLSPGTVKLKNILKGLFSTSCLLLLFSR